MPEEQNQERKTDLVTNPLKDLREWVDLIKWILIFLLSILVPIMGLIYFWVNFKPPFDVFLTLAVIYLIITLLLLKPLTFNKDEN